MRRWILVCWALLFCGVASAAEIEGGRIEGVREGGVTVYRGVPFAATPVGDLRWKPPQPVAPWSGVRQAATFAPACMQRGVSMPGETPPAVSEDCLYLNVWTPTADAGAKLPVIVWIYGGGWQNGSASMPLYWGDALARRGVVVVTVAYRVGAFGFLAHPDLSKESAAHSSGNYGLMDQIAALRWVQRNIGAFGGDARNVTIAGQSAGAMSVSILMTSPQAKGLFHRAIGQSGGFFEPVQLAPSYLLPNAEHEGEAFAASLGAKSLAELRALPAARVLDGRMPSGPHPVIEPTVLPQTPFDAFAGGRQNDVPVLLGSNAEEARSLVDVKDVKAATFAADIAKSFGPLPPPLIDAYAPANDDQAKAARIAFETDLRFGWDMWAWARLQAATGKRDVFLYRFEQKPPFPAGPRNGWGASHFAELWYMFDNLPQETWAWSADDRKLADTMAGYWVNFAKTGNPNGAGLPSWPAFAGDERPVQVLGPAAVSGGLARTQQLRIFDAVYAQIRGTPMPPPKRR